MWRGLTSFMIEFALRRNKMTQQCFVGLSLVVTTTLKDEIVNIGQTFVLTCNYSTSPTVSEIKWMHINTAGTSGFIDTTANKFSGSVPGDPSLTITNIDGNDLGDYWCYVVSSDGTGVSTPINLALPAGILQVLCWQIEIGTSVQCILM